MYQKIRTQITQEQIGKVNPPIVAMSLTMMPLSHIVIITVIILDASKAYAQTCVDLPQQCIKKYVSVITVHFLQGELAPTVTFMQNRRQPSVRSTCLQAHGQELCECFLADCYMVLSAAACILGASMA